MSSNGNDFFFNELRLLLVNELCLSAPAVGPKGGNENGDAKAGTIPRLPFSYQAV